ncbi:MAG: hypothetical protein IPM23_01125 [Candidatus Melainabacteria bacterium]|nr:hypothetical protein [Candidatus Melainabacteria bacterium]
MLETTGALMRQIAQALPSVEYLRLEVKCCDLAWGYSKESGARVFADYLRKWDTMEAERAVTAVQLGNSSERSSATVLTPAGRTAFEDIDVTLLGASRLTGSIGAGSISINLKDQTLAEVDELDADSVLVTAFDRSRAVIKNVSAQRMLIIADDDCQVEVVDCECDLVLVRQSRQGRASFKTGGNCAGVGGEALFALTGDLGRIAIPEGAMLVPQDAVDAYWRSLTAA